MGKRMQHCVNCGEELGEFYLGPGQTIRNLKCILSEEEIREDGVQMANAFNLLKADQDNLRAAQAKFRASIAGHEAAINFYANRIRVGFEYRNVECHEEELGTEVYTIRDDIDETVDMILPTKVRGGENHDFK